MKKALLIFALVATLVSCSKSGETSSQNASSTATENSGDSKASTNAQSGIPQPTGNAETDAKAYADFVNKLTAQIKTKEDLKDVKDKLKALSDAFSAYEKTADAKYKEEYKKAQIIYVLPAMGVIAGKIGEFEE